MPRQTQALFVKRRQPLGIARIAAKMMKIGAGAAKSFTDIEIAKRLGFDTLAVSF